jgi:hypothetical protein
MPLVELSDGSTVLFLVPGGPGEFEAQAATADKVRGKLEEIAGRTGQVLLEAVNGVRTSLASVAPSELEIEIAISLSQEGSIIVTSGKVEGSLKIKAVWKKAELHT